MRTIERGHVDIWYAYPAKCLSRERRQAYFAILSEDERQAHARFARQELQDEFLLTRALCRTTLSLYAALAPQSWQFGRNAFGRPSIIGPGCGASLDFNLSNSRDLVAMAVTQAGRDVGIDVESTCRTGDLTGIAQSYFSACERADLFALPPGERHRRFFDLWTLKEAYIKARGLGLSLDLRSFSILFAADDVGISFSPDGGPADRHWQLMLRHIGGQHTLALCAARRAGVDATVRLSETIPEVPAPRSFAF